MVRLTDYCALDHDFEVGSQGGIMCDMELDSYEDRYALIGQYGVFWSTGWCWYLYLRSNYARRCMLSEISMQRKVHYIPWLFRAAVTGIDLSIS